MVHGIIWSIQNETKHLFIDLINNLEYLMYIIRIVYLLQGEKILQVA